MRTPNLDASDCKSTTVYKNDEYSSLKSYIQSPFKIQGKISNSSKKRNAPIIIMYTDQKNWIIQKKLAIYQVSDNQKKQQKKESNPQISKEPSFIEQVA